MPEILEYDRIAAVRYAEKWAFSRNPRYYDFSNLGGDCTNYASQCVYEGCKIMNYTPVTGWYYNSAHDRTASWTGVEYLHRFLISNKSSGPFAEETDRKNVTIGDLVQFGTRDGKFYHTPVIVGFTPNDILLAAHSFDAYGKPLSQYFYDEIRFLHIIGYKK